MSKIQPTRVRGVSSRSTARNLIANVAPTTGTRQQIEECTIEVTAEKFQKPVTRCRAFEPMLVGNVFIPNRSVFFLVRSRLVAHRFYVVCMHRTGVWTCSSTDKAIAAKCIQQVVRFTCAARQAKAVA